MRGWNRVNTFFDGWRTNATRLVGAYFSCAYTMPVACNGIISDARRQSYYTWMPERAVYTGIRF